MHSAGVKFNPDRLGEYMLDGIEQAPDAVYWIDEDARFRYANERATKYLGYSREELTALRVMDVNPAVTEDSWGEIWNLIDTRESVTFDSEHRHKEGKLIPVEVTASMLELDGQSMVLAFVRDESDRYKAELALKLSQQRLQSILDHTSAVIFMKDVEGRYLLVNQRYLDLFSFHREDEVVGKTDFEIFDEPVARAFREADRQVIEGGERIEVEEQAPHGDEFHTYISTKFPLRDEAGEIFAVGGIATDITPRKQAMEQAARHAAELERSNRDLEEFAYVASHDLKEPLRMVSKFAGLFEKKYRGQLDDEADEFIGQMVSGTERMRSLIDDLLAYSRIEMRGGSLEPVDLESVLDAALENLGVVISESKVEIEREEKLPAVRGDRRQLIQLLQNLIGNAIKFAGEDRPRIEISSRPKESFVEIAVRDNGPGIAPENHERIFKIFQRLGGRDEPGGSGIGLAVCRRIVQRHGGEIRVESEPGEGSTFFVTLERSEG